MLIVAIAWLYVVVLMSATQPTWLAAVGTLFFYGLFPLSIVLYLIATPARRRRQRAEQLKSVTSPDATQQSQGPGATAAEDLAAAESDQRTRSGKATVPTPPSPSG